MASTLPKKPKLSEVISIVAHQLKNPLSVLKGYIEVLISEDFGRINQKQREYLEDALENVKRMGRIVGYLLDVSRIEEGKFRVRPELIDLGKMISEVIDEFSDWAQASNCTITFKKPEKALLVSADPLKIRHVIENIISNSLKFKSAGEGKIEISLAPKNKEVLFSCQDNGIGIPKKDFKKVFTKFYRSEEALEADPAGTGLGLYIDKATIELSRGKIWFKKNKGPGMTFYFTLPLTKK